MTGKSIIVILTIVLLEAVNGAERFSSTVKRSNKVDPCSLIAGRDGRTILICKNVTSKNIATLFSNLEKLTSIRNIVYFKLELNESVSIPSNFTKGFLVQELFISGKPINGFKSNALIGNEKTLERIGFNGTKLSYFPGKTFTQLSKLDVLSISDLKLSSLTKSDIAPLPITIRYLILGKGHLQSIGYNAFHSLVNLDGLSLNYNRLKSLPDNLCSTTMLWLDVKGNQLTSVPLRTISEVSKGFHLTASKNGLTTFPSELQVLPYIIKGIILNLQDNPFVCTSSMKWIPKFIKKHPTRFTISANCIFPNGTSVSIDKLQEKDLTNLS